MSRPLESHWKPVRRILRYLKGTMTRGLHLKPASPHTPLSIQCYCDVDWASDLDDRRSTSGACVFLGPNLVSWWSEKQTMVARPSTKAEYRSLAAATAEILWLKTLLSELKVLTAIPFILFDNQVQWPCLTIPCCMLKRNTWNFTYFLSERESSTSLW